MYLKEKGNLLFCI